jgi:hypothetical protein
MRWRMGDFRHFAKQGPARGRSDLLVEHYHVSKSKALCGVEGMAKFFHHATPRSRDHMLSRTCYDTAMDISCIVDKAVREGCWRRCSLRGNRYQKDRLTPTAPDRCPVKQDVAM